MGNVSINCSTRINTVVNSGGQELENQAIRGLYGYESCCNDLHNLFKVTLLNAIINQYNDLSADGQVLEVITAKQAECYCNWIQRQTPNENPVNP